MYTHPMDKDNWQDVKAELKRRLPDWQPPAQAEPIDAPAKQAVPADDAAAPHGGNGLQTGQVAPALPLGTLAKPLVGGTRAATGSPIVRAFWWGFHIECSHQGLRDFLSSATTVNDIAAAIGPVTGPAAPWVMLAATFIGGALGTLRGLDQGNGVYISMSWFAPGIFVPTTVPQARTLGRDAGEAYEQAGDVWRRPYSGGAFGTRMEEDIYWNLPNGTVRERVIVTLNPPSFGNICFNHWLSDDPTVGHFRLHVGIPMWVSGQVELRMMIRDADGTRSTVAIPINRPTGPVPIPNHML